MRILVDERERERETANTTCRREACVECETALEKELEKPIDRTRDVICNVLEE